VSFCWIESEVRCPGANELTKEDAMRRTNSSFMYYLLLPFVLAVSLWMYSCATVKEVKNYDRIPPSCIKSGEFPDENC